MSQFWQKLLTDEQTNERKNDQTDELTQVKL